MIIIDGAAGEGGGQVLRTALALSLITGQPFRIDAIRGGRPRPGLMRQHITAIEAACAVGDGVCDGMAVGASSVTFTPGRRLRGGDHHFAVGTAGSTALVLQAVLLPLLRADRPSRLVIDGGTHARAAPPFDFIAATLVPLLRRMGAVITIHLVRPGFHPVGGGRIVVEIEPSPLRPLTLLDRGAFIEGTARAVVASLPATIAARELAAARRELADWPEDAFQAEEQTAEQGRAMCCCCGRLSSMSPKSSAVSVGLGCRRNRSASRRDG